MEEYSIIYTNEFNGDISYQYLKKLTSLIDNYNTNDINWEWTKDKKEALFFTKEKSFDIMDSIKKHYPYALKHFSMKKKKERIIKPVSFEKKYSFIKL